MSSGGRRGGGGDESEDEGYVVGELGDHSGKLSWKRHMALFRRELSTGSRLLRDGSRPGSRWERFLIHPDYWYVPSLSLSHLCGSLGHHMCMVVNSCFSVDFDFELCQDIIMNLIKFVHLYGLERLTYLIV